MSNRERKGLYSKEWHPNKKKPNSHSKKLYTNDKNNDIVHQSVEPSQLNNFLSVYDSHVNFSIPYYGWKLFFENEDYKSNSATINNIKAVECFLSRHPHFCTLLSSENLENGMAFTIDIRELYRDQIFLDKWILFEKNIHENPLHTLNCFKLAIHQKILNTVSQETLSPASIVNTLSTVRLRIINYQPIMCLQDLKANFFGKLVTIRGCVIRVGHVKHLAQWILFACCKCNLQKIMKQPQGIYTMPKTCSTCGTVKFRPILDSSLIKSIPFQIIKMQELSNDDQNSKGIIPRMVDIELMDDLVNTCMPGDDITLTGIVKGTNNSKIRTKISFSLCMEAITIVNNKQGLQNKTVTNNEMSIKDYLAIKEVYNTPNIFPLLVHSLCPSIYGHEMIKAGLLLTLFGGNTDHLKLRENVHTLMIGDPGLGKSQMLQACARIASKGVYVCGNSSTSSGLTITLAKENKNNNFSLEPGALVLADRGCCCIDEFDKMSKQHAVLLEAMEQQRVSVAKSGIICSLPTRTSILAAANPIGGRFNRCKTVLQNLKMNAPLLSRFDLIFLLFDEPNKHKDDLLCKHVMSVHTNLAATSNAQNNTSQQKNVCGTEILPLRDKLVTAGSENINIIPHPVLKKYITYARQYVKPKLTKEAALMLQKYYLKLRTKYNKFDGLSVCNRQLEAMIRLTEARAKLELRTDAVESDALDVIEILQYSFDNKITQDDSARSKNITGGNVKEFIKILRNDVVSNKTNIFSTKTLYKLAFDANISTDRCSELIAKLNENGILLKTGNNAYKFFSQE